MNSMFLKLSQAGWITAEYVPINSHATIMSATDCEMPDGVAAEVKYDNKVYKVNKTMDAWLVNANGIVLEVINRAYLWGQS